MLVDNQYSSELVAIKNKLKKALLAFQEGQLILVGDDGLRENEADLVFHAKGATPQNVNFAIKYARGLLCVSLGHELADNLGFSTSPKLPGGIANTNFTVSVDAKEGITNGISAKDRALTISLMAKPNSKMSDFISPGHVFPVRAMSGGLLARAGHTEALYELCQMTKLPYAAAMCEVLGDDGDAIDPHTLAHKENRECVFHNLPFISTVDILWSKILFHENDESKFLKSEQFDCKDKNLKPISVYILQAGLEENITLPTTLSIYKKELSIENIRISITNSVYTWDNGIPRESCSAEISLFSHENCLEIVPHSVKEFSDMSGKEGLKKTKCSVRRSVSILRSMQFLNKSFNLNTLDEKKLSKLKYIVPEDYMFLNAIISLQNI
ncbi:3,4-dihydroxy-2-butanone-4-phosphate synthase [Fluviispira vulneris]|uniref:3,4-dihydroxy-2-butanone-4-phosphate synthase n=1 Tax=Fluviispira vulneris TaxID=2763012 RepID=UPI001648F191|nr:3,4-dihydroxy-2-butanone-4-phosphate synthase [Fluviispira vulneris]